MVPRASVALALAGVGLGCTRDFDAFRPDVDDAASPEASTANAVLDGGANAGHRADAAAASNDAGLPACVHTPCMDARTRCVGSCEQRRKVCVITCFGNDDCDKACLDAEASCDAACRDECSRCHTNAGCANTCP